MKSLAEIRDAYDDIGWVFASGVWDEQKPDVQKNLTVALALLEWIVEDTPELSNQFTKTMEKIQEARFPKAN